jgi:hypothetical protein
MIPLLPQACHMLCLPHPPWLDHYCYIWRKVHAMMQFSPNSSFKYSPQHAVLKYILSVFCQYVINTCIGENKLLYIHITRSLITSEILPHFRLFQLWYPLTFKDMTIQYVRYFLVKWRKEATIFKSIVNRRRLWYSMPMFTTLETTEPPISLSVHAAPIQEPKCFHSPRNVHCIIFTCGGVGWYVADRRLPVRYIKLVGVTL